MAAFAHAKTDRVETGRARSPDHRLLRFLLAGQGHRRRPQDDRKDAFVNQARTCAAGGVLRHVRQHGRAADLRHAKKMRDAAARERPRASRGVVSRSRGASRISWRCRTSRNSSSTSPRRTSTGSTGTGRCCDNSPTSIGESEFPDNWAMARCEPIAASSGE